MAEFVGMAELGDFCYFLRTKTVCRNNSTSAPGEYIYASSKSFTLKLGCEPKPNIGANTANFVPSVAASTFHLANFGYTFLVKKKQHPPPRHIS